MTYTPTPTPSSATPTASPTAPAAIPAGWVDRQYIYAGSQPHAVDAVQQAAGNDSFTYDANGNMTCRLENGLIFNQVFNSENRLSVVQQLSQGPCPTPNALATANVSEQWTFTYDGDGNRIKQVYSDGLTSTVTLFLGGGIYTVVNPGASQVVTKYYAIAGQRVAMENGDGLQYLLTDHLGSVSAVLDAAGDLLSEQRYMPFGAERLDPDIGQTDFGFTGQRDLAAAGLMDYKARWFNANVGAFTQPDTIVPDFGNPQSLNRFSYTYNNPINYTDPTGHDPWWCGDDADCVADYYDLPPVVPGPEPDEDEEEEENGVEEDLSETVIILMPPGINPSFPLSPEATAAGKFAYQSSVYADILELLFIFSQIPFEQGVSAGDLLVTLYACTMSGDCYYGSPGAGLPEMLVFNQDVLVSAIDLGAGASANLIGLAGGGAVGNIPGAFAGYEASRLIDMGFTGGEAIYGHLRNTGQLANYVSIGFRPVFDDSGFRIKKYYLFYGH